MKKSKALNRIVIIGIVLTIATLLFLPLGLTAVIKSANPDLAISPSIPAFQLSMCIYVCAVPYLIGLYKLKTICKLIAGENPFDKQVAKKLNELSICAFSQAIVYVAVMIFMGYALHMYFYALTIISTIIVIFLSIVFGVLLQVLAELFTQASNNKEEIDLIF